MIFLFFGGKYIYTYIFLITITIVNIFIVFVKFLGLIVAIWVRIAILIGEKGDPTTKMKYRITKKKKLDLGGPGPQV